MMFQWFFASGDAPFFVKEQIQTLSWLPQSWNSWQEFGEPVLFRLWYDWPLTLVSKMFTLIGFSWWWIDKFLWFSVVILALFSSYQLARYILKVKTFRIISSSIYCLNTYALMLFGGGQLGVCLGYAFAPLVFVAWMKTIDERTLQVKRRFRTNQIIQFFQNGLLLSLLMMFDLRICLLTIMLVALYSLYSMREKTVCLLLYRIASFFIVPFFVTALVHSYWILPLILFPGTSLPVDDAFSGSGMVTFLSFADFSHAFALLHPNWPENLFGKIYFMQSEFLLLPLAAYASLLFIRLNKNILFFVCIGLFGAFLAKGTNDPFGLFYRFASDYIPGFMMFRDPTKFYLFIAFSYSILIPQFLYGVFNTLPHKKFSYLHVFIVVLYILVFIYLGRPLLLGQLTGNFRPVSFSNEYQQVSKIFSSDESFYRTLWIPQVERFAFISDKHPAVSADYLYKNASITTLINEIESSEFERKLIDSGIRYVIVPADATRRMFLNDYKVDDTLRSGIISALDDTLLNKLEEFYEIAVYENRNYSSLFTLANGKIPIRFIRKSSSKYMVVIPAHDTEIAIQFRMAYNPYWKLIQKNKSLMPKRTSDGFIEYILPLSQEETYHAVFTPQKWVERGLIVSIITLISSITALTVLKRKKNFGV